MSIMSWNCRGAGSDETVQYLQGLRRSIFPDFLFLMETKQKNSYMMGLQQSLGYDKMITVEPIGLSGGLALMWKSTFDVAVLSCDNRIIDVKVSFGSVSFYLTCVYGNHVRSKRQEVWTRLIDIGLVRDEAWLLTGDFNELMSNGEKLGGAIRDESTFWDFRNMAENCKIKELRFFGNSLSWAGKRDNVWVQCRLDRSFGNDEWFSLFPRASSEYLDMWASDHRPLRISFALERVDPHRGRFFFDKRMLSKAGLEEVIKSCWGDDCEVQNSTMERINRCRRGILRWKKRADLNSKNKITRLKSALEREVSKHFPSFHVMSKIRKELALAYKEEETFWRQKCREEWLRSGNRNTKFFHNCVKGKRHQNKILMLLDDLGREHFSEGSKGDIAVNYFRELFMSSNPHDVESLFTGFQPRVTAAMNNLLLAPISEEEVRKAAFCVKSSSAPGEDGLTGVFYQRF
ncbi:uncharacterized protein LOC117127769 [Brassica rapa]|uniref:uncharacterized protein LOC117127769 n=1 Tax=Brassica campestris TaxID=3711 RepID=UPI00142D9BFD|nr:uncharacterized protein LOC117127769 [Brassica rapa]